MNTAETIIVSALTILTLWGLISPRSQWRMLTGFNQRDPGAHEPGSVVIGIHRTISGLAIAGLVVAGAAVTPSSPAPRTAVASARPIVDPITALWGTPYPVVVNRVIRAVTEPPTGLVAVPLLRYQPVDGIRHSPTYLFTLGLYSPPKLTSADGYVGTAPGVGVSALDSAQLVVQVQADRRCAPQQVLVVESSTTVVVAVYYNRPPSQLPDAAAQKGQCEPAAKGGTETSVLVPLALREPVGPRSVVDLGGAAVRAAGTRPPPAATPQ